MKRSVLIAFLMVLGASVAFAQPGSIGLFADPTLAECNVGIPPSGIIHIYAGHVNMTSSASQFCVDYSALIVAPNIFLSETATSPFLAIGTSRCDEVPAEGISIAYGTCQSGSVMILDIQFFIQGPVAPCSYLSVLPDPVAPIAGEVLSANCATPPLFEIATGGQAIANWSDPECICSVPVAESTWGGIKALYQ
jgi:hypothetical protein